MQAIPFLYFRRIFHRSIYLFLTFTAVLWFSLAAHGDGIVTSCTESALDTALAGGGTVTFTQATAGGKPANTYQWKLNGTNITGATSASYTVPSGATGTYTLVVTNSSSSCSQTSAGTSITTSARPSATATATPVTLCVGSPLTLASTGTPGAAGYNVSSTSYTAADMTAATPLVSTGVNNSTANFTGGLDDGGCGHQG